MRKTILALSAIILTVTAFAQKDVKKYNERAAEVKKEIWDAAAAPFDVKTVPAELNNESAVIIARSFEIINSAKFRFKFSLFGMGGTERLKYITTMHEKVKINDKSALEEYATIEYKKKLDKSVTIGFAKLYDKMETYVGAKIIKPDGKIITVNTDEEVMTKNEDKNKQGKLAISDLQVGDILDYYVRVEELQENKTEKQGPYTFVMGGEYPMMNYNVRLQLDEKVGIEYISANGAPAFKESKNADGDIILELSQSNLPKFESSLWTNAARQRPYISLQYKFIYKSMDASTHFNRGEVKKGTITGDLVDEFKKDFGRTIRYPMPNARLLSPLYGEVLDYFGGKKKIKEIPEDSVIKVTYDLWKYQTFADFSSTQINISNDANYRQANSILAAFYLKQALQFLDIKSDIVLVCPRFGVSLKNVLEYSDFEGMVRINSDKPTWLCFDDIVTRFNEIPQRYQGEEAVLLQLDKAKRTYEFTDKRIVIPITSADKNVVGEQLNVSLQPAICSNWL